MSRQPVETKVWAGPAAGTALAPGILWLLGVTIWGVPIASSDADTAITAVPWPVATLVFAGVTFAAGWLAPHTRRAGEHVPEHAAGSLPIEHRYPPVSPGRLDQPSNGSN